MYNIIDNIDMIIKYLVSINHIFKNTNIDYI